MGQYAEVGTGRARMLWAYGLASILYLTIYLPGRGTLLAYRAFTAEFMLPWELAALMFYVTGRHLEGQASRGHQ